MGGPLQMKQLAEATAVILAGGLGTRLRPAVGDLPKALAPVHQRPYLTYLLDRLAAVSVREVVLLTGYQADRVYQALGETYRGLRLVYSPEPCPQGTAGALRRALPKLNSPAILLMNGDSWCEVDLGAFWDFQADKNSDLSLVVVEVPDASRYGKVRLAPDGRVVRFGEKEADHGAGCINAGISLLNRGLIEEIPTGRPVSLEHDMIPGWLSRGARVHGFRCAGPFIDIGTPASYAAAEAFFPPPIDKP